MYPSSLSAYAVLFSFGVITLHNIWSYRQPAFYATRIRQSSPSCMQWKPSYHSVDVVKATAPLSAPSSDNWGDITHTQHSFRNNRAQSGLQIIAHSCEIIFLPMIQRFNRLLPGPSHGKTYWKYFVTFQTYIKNWIIPSSLVNRHQTTII